MNTMNDEQIERAVGEMTRWTGSQPEVWKRAQAQVEADNRSPRDVIGRILSTRMSPRWLAIAAVIVILVGAGVAQLMLDRAQPRLSLSNLGQFGDAHAAYSREWNGSDVERLARDAFDGAALGGGGLGGAESAAPARPPVPSEPGAASQADPELMQTMDRSVIRKATIELLSPDVRAAYLRAAQLVSQAQGEFIDDSALQGLEEQALNAHLTLRIRAERLDEVLNDLRNLGLVVSEESRGEDVTTQVVDLDARIRNEQRVEQELLDLLAQREDAPLNEILDLRNEISRVRGRIEQYTAQVQNLNKLVALATVLVIIRPDVEGEEDADEASIGEYFGDMISDSWDGGVRFLAGSIAVIIRSLVGGAIWIGLAMLAIVTIRYARQTANRSGQDSNLRPAA